MVHVEVEIWNGVAQQKLHALVVGFLVAALDHNVLIFSAVNLLWCHALDKDDGFGNTRLQLGQCFFIVFMHGYLDTGQARHHTLGSIAGNLYLLGHGQHVREQAKVVSVASSSFLASV